jgi:hypothetical protein
MSLHQLLAEDRRLVILRSLLEADQYKLNESLIERLLNRVGVLAYGRDQVRGLLAWLEQNGLVSIERLAMESGKELWVATATKLGTEVAQGRLYPGVSRPSAPG